MRSRVLDGDEQETLVPCMKKDGSKHLNMAREYDHAREGWISRRIDHS